MFKGIRFKNCHNVINISPLKFTAYYIFTFVLGYKMQEKYLSIMTALKLVHVTRGLLKLLFYVKPSRLNGRTIAVGKEKL